MVAKAGWNSWSDDTQPPAISLDEEGNLQFSPREADTHFTEQVIPGVTKFAAGAWGAIYLKEDAILYGYGSTGPDGQMAYGVLNAATPQKVLISPSPTFTLPIHPDYPDNAQFDIGWARPNALSHHYPPPEEGDLDYETKTSYKLLIRATEADGTHLDKEVTLQLTNVNESPIGVTLDNTTIAENSADTTVGTLRPSTLMKATHTPSPSLILPSILTTPTSPSKGTNSIPPHHSTSKTRIPTRSTCR